MKFGLPIFAELDCQTHFGICSGFMFISPQTTWRNFNLLKLYFSHFRLTLYIDTETLHAVYDMSYSISVLKLALFLIFVLTSENYCTARNLCSDFTALGAKIPMYSLYCHKFHNNYVLDLTMKMELCLPALGTKIPISTMIQCHCNTSRTVFFSFVIAAMNLMLNLWYTTKFCCYVCSMPLNHRFWQSNYLN